MPFTSGPLVTGEFRVGLQTEFTTERRFDFTLVATSSVGKLLILVKAMLIRINRCLPWEESTTELSLDEELSIEDLGGRVEGGSGDGLVNVIGSSDGVRSKKGNDFSGAEVACISESSKNFVYAIEGLRNSQVGSRCGRWKQKK